MSVFKFFVVTLVLCCLAKTGYGFSDSCEDVKLKNRNAGDGYYLLKNSNGQRFKVFCEFHDHYGYTFIRKRDATKIDLKRLQRCSTKVLVRHVRSDGRQYDTVMEQITSHSNMPLSVQYNNNIGYATPVNHATLGPYIYLGFLPISVAKSKTNQGYRANNRDFKFHNCDANPNSYLAFFINTRNQDPSGYYTRCCYTSLMKDWINVGTVAPTSLSLKYFFQFEMHMGGCGGYAVNGYNSLSDIVGAAIGFRFEIPRS